MNTPATDDDDHGEREDGSDGVPAAGPDRTTSAPPSMSRAKPCRNTEKRSWRRVASSSTAPSCRGCRWPTGVGVAGRRHRWRRSQFLERMTGCSCSNPRADSRAGSSANSRPSPGRQTQPAGGEDAQDVAVRHEHAVPPVGRAPDGSGQGRARRARPTSASCSPGVGPAGTGWSHTSQSGSASALRIRGGAALPRPVVPLAQVVGDVIGNEAGAACGVAGPAQRAAQDEGRRTPASSVAHRVGGALAAGQREVRAAGVAARAAPLGLARAG